MAEIVTGVHVARRAGGKVEFRRGLECAYFPEQQHGRRWQLFTRIMGHVQLSSSGCWIWQGADSGAGRGGGYGRVSIDGRTSAVHRVMYQIIYGPVSAARQIDHTCRNRLCCNPAHLELVTPKENARRRDAA